MVWFGHVGVSFLRVPHVCVCNGNQKENHNFGGPPKNNTHVLMLNHNMQTGLSHLGIELPFAVTSVGASGLSDRLSLLGSGCQHCCVVARAQHSCFSAPWQALAACAKSIRKAKQLLDARTTFAPGAPGFHCSDRRALRKRVVLTPYQFTPS